MEQPFPDAASGSAGWRVKDDIEDGWMRL